MELATGPADPVRTELTWPVHCRRARCAIAARIDGNYTANVIQLARPTTGQVVLLATLRIRRGRNCGSTSRRRVSGPVPAHKAVPAVTSGRVLPGRGLMRVGAELRLPRETLKNSALRNYVEGGKINDLNVHTVAFSAFFSVSLANGPEFRLLLQSIG